jgi:hypothetical protein
MTAVVTHSVSAGGVVDPTAAVDGAAWDANHVITGVMDVSQGGTGLSSGTSGGINYWSSTSTMASSGLLTQYGLVYGGGAAGSPVAMAAGTDGQMIVGQTGAAPLWKTMSGDITVSAAGVYAIGATKVTSAMLNADVYSTAHTWAGQQTFVAPILGTPASGVATNLTGTAAGLTAGNVTTNANLTGAVTSVGNATSLGSFTSAQLRTALTDEVGTGAAYFVGGALGTPASATLTSATGLPISTGLTGAGTGVLAALAVNVGSAGAFVTFNGALGTPSSGTLTNATGLPLAGITAQSAYTIVGNFTGSSAVPTASTIPGLTHKTTPVGADTVMLADSAASNALKYSTLTELLASVGSGVSSIAGNTGAFTLANGIDNSTNQIQLTAARRTLPTVQTFTSGTAATYTTPANCLWIEVYMVGGGGGGSGAASGTTAVAGSNGTASTFNSVNANGGTGGTASASAGVPPAGGAGGTGGSGTATRRMSGGPGQNGSNSSALAVSSGGGGSSVLFGGGGAPIQPSVTVGNAGATNSGGGGGGGYNNSGSNNVGGGGGGAGESVYLIINSPSATYTYTVGGGGAGGVATTNGGAGAAGQIQVIEHYGT